jgi:chromate reductase
MAKLIGISGSLRRGSFNTALLRAATELVPSGTELVTVTLHGVPLYDGDVETEHGLPERVRELKELIAAADGLFLATPEYNNSIPGIFKNAVDWLSRPPADIPRIFGEKPVAVIGASPGGFGTILSQNAWLPVLRTLGTRPWFGGRLLVSRAGTVFDEAGRIVNETIKEQLRQFIEGYVAFVHNAIR